MYLQEINDDITNDDNSIQERINAIRRRAVLQALTTIPPYSIWVQGDSTEHNSLDSRQHGPVSKKLLVGIAERVVWPPSRFGALHRSGNNMTHSNNEAWRDFD
jgi:hypothetical protein